MGCNQHMNIVEECRQQLNHVMEFSCDKLHNSIREFIFQRIDYSKVDSFMPQWIIDCGISPELNTSKDAYEKFKRHTIITQYLDCIYITLIYGVKCSNSR